MSSFTEDTRPDRVDFSGYTPNFEAACKNDGRNCSRNQAELIRLRAALSAIAELEFWKGCDMQRIAQEALK